MTIWLRSEDCGSCRRNSREFRSSADAASRSGARQNLVTHERQLALGDNSALARPWRDDGEMRNHLFDLADFFRSDIRTRRDGAGHAFRGQRGKPNHVGLGFAERIGNLSVPLILDLASWSVIYHHTAG